MRAKSKLSAKAGVTLIELLVVILIIIILAVTMLPKLQKYITQARYASAAVPEVGNLRTKVELYRVEHDYLPGLNRDASGLVLTGATLLNASGNSHLDSGGAVTAGSLPCQAIDHENDLFVGMRTSASDNSAFTNGAAALFTLATTGTVSMAANHFSTDLALSSADMTDRRVNPENFVYAAPIGGYGGGGYMYVIAAVGESMKLPSGTGFAVMEVYNPFNRSNPKIVATFERYSPGFKDVTATTKRLGIMFDSSGSMQADEVLANNIVVPMGLADTNTSHNFDADLTTLRTYGWTF